MYASWTLWRAGEVVLKWLRIWDRRTAEVEEALVARVAARAAEEVREGILLLLLSSSSAAVEEEEDEIEEREQEGVERAEEGLEVEEASLKNCPSVGSEAKGLCISTSRGGIYGEAEHMQGPARSGELKDGEED